MVKLDIKTYERPTTLEAAYKVLTGEGSRQIMAGGAWQRLSDKTVDVMVGLERLGLNKIEVERDVIKIGAMTTLGAIETHSALANVYDGILPAAVGDILGVPFRNTATIGGSIMGRFPFSDVLTPLLAMDTQLVFYKRGTCSLEAFLDTKRPETDILTHVIVPKHEGRGFFKKVSNTRLDFSILNIAITRHDNAVMIVFGSRPGRAVKAISAMDAVNHADVRDDACFARAAKAVIEHVAFGTNARAKAAYRKQLAKTYTVRGLKVVHRHEH